jgi:hypothetical protein
VPQALHTLPLQMAPVPLHVPVPPFGFAQHGPPSSPHLAQTPPLQFMLGAVQTPAFDPVVQQG